MLKLLLALLVLSAPLRARAEEGEPAALRRPERITVGMNDQFLGQLSPDEETLYFVSSQETRKELYAQKEGDPRARLLFDEGADVTWPRVSPDGKHLLYVSFADRAAGQLCVRDLPEGDQRRCLDALPATLQAEWIGPAHILVVGRSSIHGDLRLFEVAVGRKLSARPRFEQNWSHPAISPDGRWLLFVPLDRTATQVGPGFAARAARSLQAVPLTAPHSAPLALNVDLPGLTGQPVFSRDGRWLYFVQFLSDSNHDGSLDASDHGVLFRLPWESQASDAPSRAAASVPLQLTDSSWNCQYPAPATTRLIATCSRGRDLDLYELALDGEIPGSWSLERVRSELALEGRREEQLLLYRHALARATTLTWQRLITLRLLMAHLALEEFAAAEFYAAKLKQLRDPATRGIAQPLLVLVEHRRARSAERRGEAARTSSEQLREHMEQLSDGPKDSPAARVLNRVVRSELADALGDQALARRELESAPISQDTPRPVLEVYFERADALYRQLDDRQALIALCRRLAESPALKPDQQLDYARAMTRALTRGLPWEQADAALAAEQARVAQDGELAFALELARSVLAIREERPDRTLRERLTSLYEAQTREDRQRAIVLDAVARAAELGADGLIEGLSERYIDDVALGTQERRRVERLYRRAILGRAYRRIERERLAEARADFDEVYRRTGALEAVVGSVDLRLRQGMTAAQIQAELPEPATPDASHDAFVQAYLLAQQLGTQDGPARLALLERARTVMRPFWSELRNEAAARALQGYLMHVEYLLSRDPAAAERANAHYLVALELAQYDPRYRARVLGQLGLLHAQAGNQRIALGYLEQRAKLPFAADDAETLALKLATARALRHVGRTREAADLAEQALALLERTPALERFRVLGLDRAALANLAARRFAEALAHYDRELSLLPKGSDPEATRNRFVVQLGRAAAALGAGQPERALHDLSVLDARLSDEALQRALATSHLTSRQAGQAYRTIQAGLRSNAQRALGQHSDAQRALERQRQLLLERLAASARDEDVRAVMLIEARLALGESLLRNTAAAGRWLSLAWARAEQLRARPGARLDRDALTVLWLAAQLVLREQVPASFDLTTRLREALTQIVAARDASYRGYARWLELYLALAQLRRQAV